MQAALLTIGSEITSGQIVNSNASKISELLKTKGIETLFHISVPDHRSTILQALEFINSKVDLIFVTGGLGPTSDDFTRDVLAEYFKLKLVFDEKSFEQIKDKFSLRNYPVRDMHKQQCYFPVGAEILNNQIGTANGFYFQMSRQHVFVLPGPPKEIQSIWEDHIDNKLNLLVKDKDPLITRSWDTLGMGESEVAHIVEPIAERLRNTGVHFDIGYRVHIPYVEVKLSFYKSIETKISQKIDLLDGALKQITVFKDRAEVLSELKPLLDAYEHVVFIDEISHGRLFHRMSSLVRSLDSKLSILSFSTDSLMAEFSQDKKLIIELKQVTESLITQNIKFKDRNEIIEINLDKYNHYPLERKMSLCVEIVLLNLYKVLKKKTN